MAATHPSGRLLAILAILYAIIWIVAAIDPVSREDWLIENLLVFLALGALIWGYRHRPLSSLSYTLIWIFMAAHAVGAHYTYAEAAPGYWMQDIFGFERNHYDRVIHFSYGLLLALPCRELIDMTGATRRPWNTVFAGCVIFATSALYEIIEWIVAMIVSPETGAAYLGTQGDEFDAQKDTALAMLGCVIALLIVAAWERRRKSRAIATA
jgi:putative membrane protein